MISSFFSDPVFVTSDACALLRVTIFDYERVCQVYKTLQSIYTASTHTQCYHGNYSEHQ